jgi:hypothetical protein
MNLSPYILYASNYVPFTVETNGSYLGSVQGGNVYAGETQPDVAYGNYSSPTLTLAETQFYNIQFQWLVAGGSAKDHAYVSVNVPGSGQTYTALTPIDISQSANLLIQMGNTYTQSDNPAGTVGGNATTFTVVMNNDTSAKQDGSGQTAQCIAYQTLVSVGRNSASGTPLPLGVYNYEIPLSAFSNCPVGNLATLLSTGVTSIAVRIDGDQNKNMAANEYDTIAVGDIGFTGSSGTSSTATTLSPYILYASNYTPFAAETNGSYLDSIQTGNVYAGETQPDVAYGNYSSPATTLAETQFYNIQFQWLVAGGNARDQAYVTVLVPGSGTTFTSLTPIDISQSGNLLIQMGNTYTQSDNPAGTVGGNATTFTVVLNNDTSGKQDGSGQTAQCLTYQPLVSVGRNSASGTPLPLGVYNYEIPLSAFSNCPVGNLAKLQSTGITSIAVRIDGDQNRGLVANEYDTIAVGYIGFTM